MPMLIGVFVGRWLDRTFDSGLFWTAPLLMLGAVARLLVRLEMDAKRMNILRSMSAAWAMPSVSQRISPPGSRSVSCISAACGGTPAGSPSGGRAARDRSL